MNKQLTTERFIPLELINPTNSKSVHTDALIDTGADVTVVPAELAEQLWHATTGGMGMIIQTASGQMTAYSHIFDLVMGDTVIRNKNLIVLPNIKMVLLGWDILATHSIFYSYPLSVSGDTILNSKRIKYGVPRIPDRVKTNLTRQIDSDAYSAAFHMHRLFAACRVSGRITWICRIDKRWR